MTNTILYPGGRTDTWVNSDGLQVKFGLATAQDSVVGAPWRQDEELALTLDLDYTRFGAFGADTSGVIYGGSSQAGIPLDAIITRVTCNVDTLFSTGSSPTLTLGLVDEFGQEIDNNGLLATGTVAHLNKNNVTSEVGALVNYGPLGDQAVSASSGTLSAGFGSGIGSIRSIAATAIAALATPPIMAYPWAAVGTANFTTGHAKYRIFYILPSSDKGGPFAS